jgi:D-beta-D-heptose 7-phosphate kinase/D-beta-D-heptose 1-phosphate adenosyltransferase
MKKKPSLHHNWIPRLDRFKKIRVLVVGDVMHDVFIWGRVSRISPEAPVPVVEVTGETTLLGGAANVAANVAALGAGAALAGVIGSDAAGEEVVRGLEKIKADHSCLRRSKTRPTPVKTRIIAHQQQVVRFDREEKRPVKPSTFKTLWSSIRRIMDRTDAVIVSDYAKGLVSPELMSRLLRLCAERDKIIAVDPKPGHMDWYRGATVVTPNNKEASEMAGVSIESDESLEEAGEIILDRLGCRALLVTRGEKGMSLFAPGRPAVHIPARAREVYDVTGAGDTVVGALTVAMAAGMEPADAAALANLAAGIVVGKLGTSVAALDEIKAEIKSRAKK